MATKRKKPKSRKPKQTECPSGHQLPNDLCTPLKCAATREEVEPRSITTEAGLEESEAEIAFQLRSRLTGLPAGLNEDESEEWAEKKLNTLKAVAAADIEYDLKYGDSQARREARRDLLAATGMRNREQKGSITPSIVISIGSGEDAPPWLKREASKQLVEATKVEED